MFLDLAIAFDAKRRCCDLVYDGRRLKLDATPLTPMLISLGTERRAEPDDELPDGSSDSAIAGNLNARRGCPADAFGGGARGGSRHWLLSRSKLTDDVLLAAEDYGVEALGWIEEREGVEIEVGASRPAPNVLMLDVRCGAVRRQLRLPVAA